MSDYREFPTAIVLSLTTGRLVCDFGELQEALEWFVDSPVFTHSIPRVYPPILEDILKQYPNLSNVDTSDLNSKNYKRWLARQEAVHGKTFTLYRGRTKAGHVQKDPIQEAVEMFGPKKTIIVEVKKP